MGEAIEEILKMEREGDFYGALALARTLLRVDPNDSDAMVAFARVRLNHRIKSGVNMQMSEIFLSPGGHKNRELKRWLINGL
ncbi:MAG: hypothetical protein J6M14_04050 [Campylobacter sp.]|nr:hypothetical protein [Campylobacter sp.]